MKDAPDWKTPKWPFLLAYVVFLAAAAGVIHAAHRPISQTEEILVCVMVGLGSLAGCWPFILDYRATEKLIEVNGMTTVMEQLEDLKQYSAQIATATDQWARVQETTKGHADKTVATAKEITDRMTAEIREFNEFQAKLNDMEKGALKLEVEKLRRGEGEWMQVVARILDHVFSLYTAAGRSGQPELAEQIALFQTACRDAARRVGLVPFGVEPNEKFDPARHRAQGVENPAAGTLVTGLLAPGVTFQGRLIRLALVKLAGENETAAQPATVAEVVAGEEKIPAVEKPEAVEGTANDELTLEPD
jgi:molecular chaperone GrpE (heat shock protein)